MSKVGELYVDVRADTSKFREDIDKNVKKPLGESTEQAKEFERSAGAAFAKAGEALQGFGSKATAAGKNLSLKLTAPLVAIGGAAFKMSSDFESSMSKIVGLVGVAADEVEAWEGQVKDLAGTYGKSAKESADALFFITSAGLRGADAITTLEASLKASAVGLGDVSTVADLATSAMNAYGSSVLPASKATDIMVAAVREGKLEASELAGSMGKVLPIASSMGVRFDEVGATFAALSRTGTDASEAATQLRGILGALLKPTSDAEKQLTELGLSSSDLRTQIGEQGLFATLQTLTSAFGDNETAQARVFGNVRALAGVMDLMGANVETTEAIFDAMTTTTGDLDKAFEVTSETAGFKMAQAFSQMKIALMEFGDIVSPLIVSIGSAVKFISGRFREMDDGTKKIVIAIGLMLAAIGPGLLIVGKLASVFGVFFKTIGFGIQVVNAMRGATVASIAATKVASIVTGAWAGAVRLLTLAWAANPIGLIVVALGVLVTGLIIAYKRFETFRVVVNTVINFVVGYFEFMANMWIKVINFIVGSVNNLTGVFRAVGINVGELGRISELSLGRLSTSSDKATGETGKLKNMLEGTKKTTDETVLTVDDLVNGLIGVGTSAEGASSKASKLAEAIKKIRTEIGKDFVSALETASEGLKKAKESFDSYRDSVAGAVTSLLSFNDAQKSSVDNSKALTDALTKEKDAQSDLEKAIVARDLLLNAPAKDDPEAEATRQKEIAAAIDLVTKAEKDVATATNAVMDAQKKPMTFFDTLTEQANKTKDFGVLVNRLLAAGLSQEALQQVLDAGVESGSAIANEILNSADGVLKANTLVAEVQAIGTSVGINAAGQFRQAGIDTAQALVDGINSVINNYTIKLKSKKLTNKQLKQLQKQFSLDVDFVMSTNVPQLANGAIVNSRTPAIIGEAGPEVVIPISRPARALQLMEQSGLTSLARGSSGSAVNIENATFVSPIDADLLAQKVMASERARSL